MDTVPRPVGGDKKGEALEMIPVEVRQEEVKDGGGGTLSRAEEGVAEIPQAGPRIAEDELLLTADLDAGGVAPVTPPHGKGEIPIDKSPDRLIGRKGMRP